MARGRSRHRPRPETRMCSGVSGLGQTLGCSEPSGLTSRGAQMAARECSRSVAISRSSAPSVTSESAFSRKTNGARLWAKAWLFARAKPTFSTLAMTRASRAHCRLPSVEALSTTMISYGTDGGCRHTLSMQRRNNSPPFQFTTTMESIASSVRLPRQDQDDQPGAFRREPDLQRAGHLAHLEYRLARHPEQLRARQHVEEQHLVQTAGDEMRRDSDAHLARRPGHERRILRIVAIERAEDGHPLHGHQVEGEGMVLAHRGVEPQRGDDLVVVLDRLGRRLSRGAHGDRLRLRNAFLPPDGLHLESRAAGAELIQGHLDGRAGRAIEHQPAFVKEDAARAERAHRLEVVADEEDGPPFAGDVADLAQALLLERGVADGEHFVDQKDLRIHVRGHGEGQAHVHAAGVTLDRRVDKL